MTDINKKIEINSEEALFLKESIKNISTLKELIQNNLEKDLTSLIQTIFGGAIILDASDLHIEVEEEQAKLRARIDGMLTEIFSFDLDTYKKIISRIKLLAVLKLNIEDKPQDGRFSIIFDNNEIEIRTSTLPTEYGETAVLRVLNPKNLISLEDLGLRKDLYEIFKKQIKRPNGMIIVTGPTGSGKTTTLYAFLKQIRKPEIKIITIEDPIEYHLKGISQTQVNPSKGYDFASGLKSIVRQDPDAVLVGEIRDLETATIALQSALTGHLVLSTLHTNDAAGTIARLQSLGETPVNIAPAINMIVAQRLIRKVCKKCTEYVEPTKEEKEKIKNFLQNFKTPLFSENIKIARIKGCKDCNFTGYKGRVGIFEAFVVDENMKKIILKNPSIGELRESAVKNGMTLMRQDGAIKILEQKTTIEEIERVVGE